ncbi:MAG: glycosyl hydrolase family 18 protein, partial [Candidatus Moraniibacteriota bacterium]
MNTRTYGIVGYIAMMATVVLVGAFFLWTNGATVGKNDDTAKVSENGVAAGVIPNTSTGPENRKFFVSGWLPYWAKEAGAASLRGNMNTFTEINPFAYGVNVDGTLVDTMQLGMAPWPELIADADRADVRIVPTILWGDAVAMHRIFSDETLSDRHIASIVAMLDYHGFSGVDIDYEGKDIADRDGFSSFLTKLHEKLSADGGKTLNCTVEARTQDTPPDGFTGTRAMSYANDYAVLDRVCDTVRVMAYDQVLQVHRANTFTASNPIPTAPNADSRWAEEVVRYALRYVSPDKLILGVPTYGWEFRVEKISDGYRYARVKSISYPDAIVEARSADITPTRTEGGELSFTYQASDGTHIVTVDDAESVRNKIDIAKKLHLKGISLFKIDGLTDPKLFDVLSIYLKSQRLYKAKNPLA